ncbi:MAG: hypothetical protein PHE29_01565 [Tissierellia bacterium]|nr:hypothetical protein [Tissierellia bacterium]MDD4781636.1 hypothetical protein [Tissierellia bacterium]
MNFMFIKEYEYYLNKNNEDSFYLASIFIRYFKSKKISTLCFKVIAVISIFIIFYDFFLQVIRKIKFNKLRIVASDVYINSSSPKEFNHLRRKKIYKPEFNVLNFPYKMKLKDVKKINIECLLPIKSYIKALNNSIKSNLYLMRKYGLNGAFYSITSYKYFLMNEFLNSLPDKTNIYFNNQKDRWALLFDSMDKLNKNLVQHGTNIVNLDNPKVTKFFGYDEVYKNYYLNMPYKLKNIDTLYAFTEKEARYVLLGEQTSDNLDVVYIGYPIILTPIGKAKNTVSVLIVGCYNMYFEEEMQLLDILKNESCVIYLKPHPTMEKKIYRKIKDQYCFILITEDIFPDVDIVFSYSSTLAFEYENSGKKVIYYNNIRTNNSNKINRKEVLKLLNYSKKSN